jgi:hypothetical protein
MRKRAVLLESLILIRIYSRDPGQHSLVKQRLTGVSGDPFVFSRFCAKFGGGDTFFSGNGLFSSVWALLLTVFKLLYHLETFLL